MKAFIALGSNLGASRKILGGILKDINKVVGGKGVVDCSNLYISKAQLVEDQAPFYNAVVEVEAEASLSPNDLLRRLKTLEGKFEKSPMRFGPRELDLDIVALGDNQIVNHDKHVLEVPHPRAWQRDFVLRPLCDLVNGKDAILDPEMMKTAQQLLRDSNPTAAEKCYQVRNTIWGSSSFENRKSEQQGATNFEQQGATNDASRTMVMGILNVTPDSFSDGGKYNTVDLAVKHALEMIEKGVDVIDIGGESTRPNATPINFDEELKRVLPVIKEIRNNVPMEKCKISIDTRKAEIAREAILAGADIINDEVGELDDEAESMLQVASELNVPLMTMHARGNARTMNDLVLEDDVNIVQYVKEWLEKRASSALTKHSIPSWNVMIDPGLGFAKSNAQNLEILGNLNELTRGKHSVLIGASRKRFVRDKSEFDIDLATSATTVASIAGGAAMVRCHNVDYALESVRMGDAIFQK